jgi:GNAT superfamily N-acetyltransferase
MADNLPNPEVTWGEITSNHMDDGLFRQILALSISVFEPDAPGEDLRPTSQLSTWGKHIQLPGATLFYAMNSTSQPIGFFFLLPRTIPEIGHELLHIWIACVHPASRGLGIFPRLTDKVKAHARELGYPEITVCTYPNRFTKMYRILSQNGWQEVCWPEKDVKVLMKLRV